MRRRLLILFLGIAEMGLTQIPEDYGRTVPDSLQGKLLYQLAGLWDCYLLNETKAFATFSATHIAKEKAFSTQMLIGSAEEVGGIWVFDEKDNLIKIFEVSSKGAVRSYHGKFTDNNRLYLFMGKIGHDVSEISEMKWITPDQVEVSWQQKKPDGSWTDDKLIMKKRN